MERLSRTIQVGQCNLGVPTGGGGAPRAATWGDWTAIVASEDGRGREPGSVGPQKVENKEASTRKHSPANILILAP